MDAKTLLAFLSMFANTKEAHPVFEFHHKKLVKRIVQPKKRGYRGHPSKDYDPETRQWRNK
jgi:hypothetical protein